MITAQNLRIHELIGLRAAVAKSLSLPYQGLSGVVADETKNTLVLRTRGGEKRVPKKGCVFLFTLPGGEKAELDGSRIAYRPFDRPKKLK
jgi:ribonuclease P protein subunit POP4